MTRFREHVTVSLFISRSLWDESEERVDACDTHDEQGKSPHNTIEQGVARMSQNYQRSEPSLTVHHALPIHLLLPASASVGER